jgi:hypothetical protein
MQNRMRHFVAASGLAALLAFVGCASPAAPTTSAPPTVTDTFSSTLAQQSSNTHQFVVNATGQVTITLATVSPLATMSLGIGIMTSDGTNCLTTMSFNTDARADGVAALLGTATKGNYCVRVYDNGNIPTSTTTSYTVTVEHP